MVGVARRHWQLNHGYIRYRPVFKSQHKEAVNISGCTDQNSLMPSNKWTCMDCTHTGVVFWFLGLFFYAVTWHTGRHLLNQFQLLLTDTHVVWYIVSCPTLQLFLHGPLLNSHCTKKKKKISPLLCSVKGLQACIQAYVWFPDYFWRYNKV